jgi:hypothetical protein
VNSVTAKVFIVDPSDDPAIAGTAHVVGQAGESAPLGVTLDTTKPATPAAPDLVASSDSGGIDDDNITTVTAPKFAGTGEANALVRIYANAILVGQGQTSTTGAFEITVNPLSDGVYSVTTRLEDLAGNVSDPSPALKVTIASQSLTLPGTTASGGAAGLVTVDLAAGTIQGYPGIAGASGKIGIVGIPIVNLSVNGQPLTILGTPSDDGLRYSPTDAQAGTLTRDGSTQVLNFAEAGGAFTIDPLGGNDTLTVNGTAAADAVTATVNTTTVVQVGSLKAVSLPIANVERLAIVTGQGADTVNVTTFDTVNASLLVDTGEPTTNTPNGDTLNVSDGSGSARVRKQPGGPVPNSGSVLVEYTRTTNNQTRIDYVGVEKIDTH